MNIKNKIVKLFNYKITDSVYANNIIKLFSGTMLSQIIVFVSAPLITRIFEPSEFGIFALFISILSILSAISCFKYDSAIILPQKENEALSLLVISVINKLQEM